MTQTAKQTILSISIVVLMVGIFLALPNNSEARVFGKDRMVNASSTKSVSQRASSTLPVRQVKNLSCVQTAVLERETAVTEAWTAYNTDMLAGLTKRTDALVEAWKITNAKERGMALKNLWKTWKTDSQKAHVDMKTDRKAAWTDFKKTVKEECKENNLPKEDAEPTDASGTATI